MNYSTISLEGGLFNPDLLERISQPNSNVPGQTARDFELRPNRTLLDEIQSGFSDATLRWDAFNRRRDRSRQNLTTLTRQDWAIPFFEILGFPPLELQRAGIDLGGTTFPISHFAYSDEHAPPVHVVSPDQSLDQRSRTTRRSPHALVQEYLNRSETLWGVVTNGAKLRLLRDSARLSKPTYLEFDLQAMLEGNAYGEFTALYRLVHSTRFPQPGAEPHDCLLESYYNQGVEEGGRVREKLREGVKNALEILGAALLRHPDNAELRESFRNGRLTENAYYRQLLSFVYRLLFLMVSEERKILFNTGDDTKRHNIYHRYYSITSLRERAERRYAGDTHTDLWHGLAQTFRLFRGPAAADALNLFPMNGELFKESTCRDLENAVCPNEDFLRALGYLSTFRDGDVVRRVNYAHLDVEEFGSVYESLLDYRPLVLGENEATGRRPNFQLAPGTERKQTGSYYTPPELVRELVDSALVPVINERLHDSRTAEAKEQALLSLRVCDPAAGSGHFLLAAARRIARELARARSSEEEPPPNEYRTALRDVVRNCIYAVDKNPLAVDLCKVALWIESHAAGFPLGFLDHHIKCGDSLVGVKDLDVLYTGIPDGAYKAVTGDDRNAATDYRKRNRQERKGQATLFTDQPNVDAIAAVWTAFTELEEHSPAEVQAKENLYEKLRGPDTHWWQQKVACDLWTYAFFAPLQPHRPGSPALVPTTDNIRQALANRSTQPQLEAAAIAASQANTFFHWPLEFPDVFHAGGFDVVLGNPPWERIKLQEKEFFETRDQEIADAPNKAARDRLIQALAQKNPELAQEFSDALHQADSVSRFVRGSNRFMLTGRGDVNTYSIFAETVRTLCNSYGRAGMIVPSGIATDDTTKLYFADLVNRKSLVSLYDFENRERVFPGIDSRIKFCLLTLTGVERPSPQAEFAFFLHSTEQIRDQGRHFVLEPADFALFNPNTRTCPIFRTQRDMEIARKMYRRAGVLCRETTDGEPEANPWGVEFSTMFHMSNDSEWFRTREQLESDGWELQGNEFVLDDERYIPLYEAKLLHQYDHRYASFSGAAADAIKKGNARDIPLEGKTDPHTTVIPRYWVPDTEVTKRLDKGNIGSKIGQGPGARGQGPGARGQGPGARGQGPGARGQGPGARGQGPGARGQGPGARGQGPGARGQGPGARGQGPGARGQGPGARGHITSLSASSPGQPTGGQSSVHWRRPTGWGTRPQSSDQNLASGPAPHYQRHQPENGDGVLHADQWPRPQGRAGHTRNWLIPFRKTARATDQRTCITAFTPRVGMSDRAPMLDVSDAGQAALLVANLNCFALDFAARSAIGGTDLSYFIIKQLPVLPPTEFEGELDVRQTYTEFIAPRVLELSYTAWDLQPLAEDFGYHGPPFRWEPERRFLLQCELEAALFHLYDLDHDEVDYIMDTFPGVARADIQEHGEYRTKRVILEIYDDLNEARQTNLPYLTRLNPPPADPAAAHQGEPLEFDS